MAQHLLALVLPTTPEMPQSSGGVYLSVDAQDSVQYPSHRTPSVATIEYTSKTWGGYKTWRPYIWGHVEQSVHQPFNTELREVQAVHRTPMPSALLALCNSNCALA